MPKIFKDKNDNVLYTGYETSEVVANPTLAGTEADLTGLQVGETKYKMPAQPTVNDSTITFTQGGETKGTITLNQSSNETIALDEGPSYSAGTGINITNDTINVDTTTVAMKTDVPTVNNATITFTQGGTTKGSITLNQSENETIELDAGGGGASGSLYRHDIYIVQSVGNQNVRATIISSDSTAYDMSGLTTYMANNNYQVLPSEFTYRWLEATGMMDRTNVFGLIESSGSIKYCYNDTGSFGMGSFSSGAVCKDKVTQIL